MNDYYSFFFEHACTAVCGSVEFKKKGKFKNKFMVTVWLLSDMGIENIVIGSIHSLITEHDSWGAEYLSGKIITIENGIVEFELMDNNKNESINK